MSRMQFTQKFILLMFAFLLIAFAPLTAKALTLVNGTSSEINAVFISDSGTDDWEENLIPEGYVLPPGNKLEVKIEGSYKSFDLLIKSSDGGEEDYRDFPGKTKLIEFKGEGNSNYK